MKKNVVKINESTLRKMISESVKKVLNESFKSGKMSKIIAGHNGIRGMCNIDIFGNKVEHVPVDMIGEYAQLSELPDHAIIGVYDNIPYFLEMGDGSYAALNTSVCNYFFNKNKYWDRSEKYDANYKDRDSNSDEWDKYVNDNGVVFPYSDYEGMKDGDFEDHNTEPIINKREYRRGFNPFGNEPYHAINKNYPSKMRNKQIELNKRNA